MNTSLSIATKILFFFNLSFLKHVIICQSQLWVFFLFLFFLQFGKVNLEGGLDGDTVDATVVWCGLVEAAPGPRSLFHG